LVLGLAKVVNSSLSIGTDVLNFSSRYRTGLLFIAVLTATAIVMNTCLIGIWGIGGAAAATLIAYAVYFALLLGYVWLRLRVSLFSWGQAKMLVVMTVAMAAAAAWQRWLSPAIGNIIVDAVVKTVTLGTAVVVWTYHWHISPTVNDILDKFKVKF